MKLIWLFLIFIPFFAFGQAPEKVSFQAVVYDNQNKLAANRDVKVRLSILSGTIDGTVVYQEIHSVKTNGSGLFTLEVGNGNSTIGTFGAINWGSAPHFLKREFDLTGGDNYSISGIGQILSVPYAIYASVSDTTLKVPDDSPTNELQMLSISNDTIYLTDGGFVKLPSGMIDTDQQSLSTSRVGNQITIEIERGTGITFTDNVDDADNSPTNELQMLSISNDTIYLTDGGFVKLPVDNGSAINQMLYWNGSKWVTLNSGSNGQLLTVNGGGLSWITLPPHIQYSPNTLFCASRATEIIEVTNPTTGKTWMDRNLGANRAATSSTDVESYGSLYQWGRGSDGHQCINRYADDGVTSYETTDNLSITDQPRLGDFILATNSPFDWRSPQNENLWQGVNGLNNPCPSGYRIPTGSELNAERLSWNSNDATGAYASPLKFTVGGRRNANSGSFANVGLDGIYWSSTVSSSESFFLVIYNNNAAVESNTGRRATGVSVRCIKD
jgi:uncharacterized protein (TIGR02145 family)